MRSDCVARVLSWGAPVLALAYMCGKSLDCGACAFSWKAPVLASECMCGALSEAAFCVCCSPSSPDKGVSSPMCTSSCSLCVNRNFSATFFGALRSPSKSSWCAGGGCDPRGPCGCASIHVRMAVAAFAKSTKHVRVSRSVCPLRTWWLVLKLLQLCLASSSSFPTFRAARGCL